MALWKVRHAPGSDTWTDAIVRMCRVYARRRAKTHKNFVVAHIERRLCGSNILGALTPLRRNWHPVTHAALMSQLNLSERLPDELAGRLLHGAETARTEERVVHTDGRA